jgi:hypothetical protein
MTDRTDGSGVKLDVEGHVSVDVSLTRRDRASSVVLRLPTPARSAIRPPSLLRCRRGPSRPYTGTILIPAP